MYDNQRIKKPRRREKEPDPGVFDPSKFWGQVLPGPATTAGPDSFDARVERALRFMRNMFFTPEEHAALSEAMVRLVLQEQKANHLPHPHSAHKEGFNDQQKRQSQQL
jgi:hypothetical protein